MEKPEKTLHTKNYDLNIPLLRAEELKIDTSLSKDKANLLNHSRAIWQLVSNSEKHAEGSVLQLHECSI